MCTQIFMTKYSAATINLCTHLKMSLQIYMIKKETMQHFSLKSAPCEQTGAVGEAVAHNSWRQLNFKTEVVEKCTSKQLLHSHLNTQAPVINKYPEVDLKYY